MAPPSFFGIGTDIVEISRIHDVFKKHGQRFLNRIYLPQEQSYCLKAKNPIPRLAARFAAKEAVAKSLGSGLGFCSWLDIEVTKNNHGQPMIIFSEKLRKIHGSISFFLSLSHSLNYAIATAICFKTNQENVSTTTFQHQ